MKLNFLKKCWSYVFLVGLVAVTLVALTLGCQQQRVENASLKPNSCPLPEELPSEDLNKVQKFGAEIKGLMSSLAGGELNAEIQKTLKRTYPDAGDVNRIYALSYAACISCRLDPKDTKGCAQRFDTIIDGYTPKNLDPNHPAKAYRSKLLKHAKEPK